MTRLYLILGFIFAYCAFKSTQLWPSQKFGAIFIAAMMFVFVLSVMSFSRSHPVLIEKKWFSASVWTAYVLMGFLGTFIILSLPLDIVQIFVRSSVLSQSVPLVLFFSSLVFSVVGLYQAVRGPRVTSVSISVSQKQFQGIKIAQISDLHVGPTIKKGYVEDVVSRTNATGADFIFITGDLIDGNTDIIGLHLEPLRNLKSKFGTYYVTGRI